MYIVSKPCQILTLYPTLLHVYGHYYCNLTQLRNLIQLHLYDLLGTLQPRGWPSGFHIMQVSWTCCTLLHNGLTSLDDFNTGHICTQVIGSNTDIDPILVHLCDTESEITTGGVRVQVSGFSPFQYPGISNGRVPSGCTHQVNRLAEDNWRHWVWLYSYPTGWICGCSAR